MFYISHKLSLLRFWQYSLVILFQIMLKLVWLALISFIFWHSKHGREERSKERPTEIIDTDTGPVLMGISGPVPWSSILGPSGGPDPTQYIHQNGFCRIVCSFCQKSLGRRWSSLCPSQCPTGQGPGFEACFVLWYSSKYIAM